MNNSESVHSHNKKSKKKQHSPVMRRVGYIAAIIAMIVVIYILRHLREWGLTILTEDFSKCLIYIEFSIYVSIAGQVLFIFYDHRWFRHFIEAITSIASVVALIMLYVIFPFSIEDGSWDKWIKIGILVVCGLTVISVIVNIVKGFRYLATDTEAA